MSHAKQDRLYGVDIARILAILLVVVFHANGSFSGFDCTKGGRIITAATICCVDLFAVISGYVGITAKFRWSRIINLWIQVVFTGAVIVGAGTLLGFFSPTLKDWGKVFVPISSHAYWYLTEYFGLFLLMPFINAGFAALSKRLILQLAVVLFVFVVTIPSLNPYASDTYAIGSGLSVIWLVICYLIGGTIRTLDNRFGNFWFWLAATILSIGASWCYIGAYSHPLVIMTAICYFMTCIRITVKSEYLTRPILMLSSCSFGVYIWHVQPLLHEKMKGCLAFVCSDGAFIGSVEIVAFSILIWLTCVALEFLRMRLFALFNIDGMVKKVVDQ